MYDHVIIDIFKFKTKRRYKDNVILYPFIIIIISWSL
jgi:hypothetical protein